MNLELLALSFVVAFSVGAVLILVLQSRAKFRAEEHYKLVLARYARNIGAGEAILLRGRPKPAARLMTVVVRHMDEKLAAAQIISTAQRWILGSLSAAIMLGLAVGVASNAIFGLLAAAGLATYLLQTHLNLKSQRIKTSFANELPQVLDVALAAIRNGLSFEAAIRGAAGQTDSACGKQFARALAEMEYGSTLDEALFRVSKRMENKDLEWLVLALEIQRQVGGSLQKIMNSATETIRARAEITREVRVLAAEGRLSSYVIIALPLFAFLALLVLRPAYVAFFWTSPVGAVLLLAYLLLVVVGWNWLKKLVQIGV